MQFLDNNTQAFLALVRAGLWGDGNPDKRIDGTTDWDYIYRLAQEQSVQGLVLQGIEWFKVLRKAQAQAEQGSKFNIPQVLLLQWIGEVQVIEQRNKEMNAFIAELIEKLRKNDIYAMLVKGQGIAQCYEKPMWRACGDVDLLLNGENYRKAYLMLSPIASSVDEENLYNRHMAMTIDGWSVELHGTLRSGLWGRIDKALDKVQETVFYGECVRSWQNGSTRVFLPGVNEDVFFVFSHILQHFYNEGIGLRQICDWCKLLWSKREEIDVQLLEKRLKNADVMSEWKVFGALAVEYLGMPMEAIPMFGSNVQEFKGKTGKVMSFILETGNFGHNRDYSYRRKHSYLIFKAISMWKHIKDFGRYFVIFPLNSIAVTWRKIKVGLASVAKGK